MGGDSPDISAVIVSYNTRDLLRQCIRSLYEQTPSVRLEVIVVDNASNDDSCRMLREEFPFVRLIASETNLGYSRGNNLGMAASSGRYILLLNPDTVIRDRSIVTMFTYLASHPEVGACGCRLLNRDGTYQRSAYPLPSLCTALGDFSALFERFPALGHLLAPEWQDRPCQTRPVGYCTAACLLVSRACVDDTGLMDESFFLYGEDVDWCKCMWQSNWPVHYLAQGGVVHYDGASQPDYVGRRLRQLGGVRQYVRKWHGRTYARAYAAIVWVCSLYRYVAFNWRRHRLGAMGEWLAPYIRFYRTIVLGPKGLRRES